MNYSITAALLTAGLLLAMLGLLELGRRAGARRIARDPASASAGAGTADGAGFALLGLLIAFSFSGAASRFDVRRALIVEETNAIGTAYLRLDLLPSAARPVLRETFRQYVDARLEVYRKLPDVAAAEAQLARANVLQQDIWRRAVDACQQPGAAPSAAVLVVPALNAMIDITTTRTMAAHTHPPTVVFVMLFVLAMLGALLAGYGMAAMRSHPWIHMLTFSITIALAAYVILDLEFPRLGLIQVADFDRALIELRESMQ
jgi:hypothetical protein